MPRKSIGRKTGTVLIFIFCAKCMFSGLRSKIAVRSNGNLPVHPGRDFGKKAKRKSGRDYPSHMAGRCAGLGAS